MKTFRRKERNKKGETDARNTENRKSREDRAGKHPSLSRKEIAKRKA